MYDPLKERDKKIEKKKREKAFFFQKWFCLSNRRVVLARLARVISQGMGVMGDN
jgi:hypothetical protein